MDAQMLDAARRTGFYGNLKRATMASCLESKIENGAKCKPQHSVQQEVYSDRLSS